ncbi:AIPR family protein [Pseudomonas fluorescens]|uniref:Abortive phage resistance protein n=1 Tax=Pseudomonas fluorescens TaxID=294 RepID=A0A0F4SW56_PSEFL|nr:AIPR family protein [Pseudomonas fluorescens]KJZ36413.1 abortive phage resistance protein [Pseudomonas fluorescens]
MAKNDQILLDGIIDDRVEIKLPSERRDEVFEFLAFEQILKDYALSKDEIESGWVDGRNDGGIDGFYIVINGHILADPESFIWPKSGSQLEIWIVTCKHHDTFKQASLDSLVATISELFDLSLKNTELRGDYSALILKARENLKLAYKKLSSKLTQFSFNFAYASRGDTAAIGESIISRANQIVALTKDSFSSCEAKFVFFGSSELIELYRKKPNYSLELEFNESLSRGEKYVLLTSLRDYYRFITDNGALRRYLFDSNVRDFMGANRVNEDIKSTLESEDSPDFWSLNNGVTILTTSASIIGKSIKLDDIQIVNGLQTTESIFRYFESGGQDKTNRSVLVKVIVSTQDYVRDEIIRATNNQTAVELASLHATDKIQRDIEEVLERSDFHYERRTNYYKNLGHPPALIVTPLYLAAGFVSLVLKSPHTAHSLKSRFMRSDESYSMVFSQKAPINVWPKIAAILKFTDNSLEEFRPLGTSANERFLKNWRHVVSFIFVAKILKSFDYSPVELAGFDLNKLDQSEFRKVWEFVLNNYPMTTSGSIHKKKSFYIEISKLASDEFSIPGVERVERIDRLGPPGIKKSSTEPKSGLEFALKLNDKLPPQPWKPGIHRHISRTMKCTISEYFDAVAILISEGLRHTQKDGVVYDSDGDVISFDPDRVDPSSMELLAR